MTRMEKLVMICQNERTTLTNGLPTKEIRASCRLMLNKILHIDPTEKEKHDKTQKALSHVQLDFLGISCSSHE